MSLHSIQTLEENVRFASHQLTRMASYCDAQSKEYQKALKKFAVAWFVLKKTRSPDEFI